MVLIKRYIKNTFTEKYVMEHKWMFKEMKKVFFIIIILVMTILFILSVDIEYGNPKNLDVANYYIDQGLHDTGAINLVAAVYLGYRAYDTLIETIVLFVAVTGVVFCLRGKR